jgi:uncharacterized phage protein (TIGR01671 family)
VREIKFRAWDKEYRYMYGNAYPFEHLVYVEMFDDDDTFGQFKHKMMVVNGKYFYFIIAKDIELMQYTGLKDKKGKDIYEDDIVNWLDIGGHKYQVVYEDCGFVGIDLESDDGGDIDLAMQELEVIGNVWENPELATQ